MLLHVLWLGGVWAPAVAAADDQKPVLRIGLFDLPPLHFIDETGSAAGYFPDLVNAIARQENWQVDYVFASFADCLTMAENGEVDLLTTIAYTPDRAQYLSYGKEPVLDIWSQAFVDPGSGLNDIRDLNDKKNCADEW